MFRLTNRLAMRRILYPAPVFGGPDAVVIEVLEGRRACGLALGRFYPMFVESALEHAEFEA